MARINGPIQVWSRSDTVPTDAEGGFAGGDSTAAAVGTSLDQSSKALGTVDNLAVTASTLDYGQEATATISGAAPYKALHVGIPKGMPEDTAGQILTEAQSAATSSQTSADAAQQSAVDADAAVALAQQAQAAAYNVPDVAMRDIVSNDVTATRGALDSLYGQGAGVSLAPLYVDTTDLAGSINAAPGVRDGLPTTRHTVVEGDGATSNAGYDTEHVATGVSGVAGEHAVTVTDSTTLATLHGTGGPWDATVLTDAAAYTFTILSVSGTTATTLQAVPDDFTGGTLSSRIDDVQGQHLTKAGYTALARHIATWSPLLGTRGGIIAGQWDTLPATYADPWAKNAALAAYGEQNSAAPVVRTSLGPQIVSNPYASGILIRPNITPGGVRFGTHTAGHGVTSTLHTGGRPAVIEMVTSATRSNAVPPTARLHVTATTGDGSVIYDETVHGGMTWHRIPTSADAVTVEVSNSDGGIYGVDLGQLTVREAGRGTRLATKKALLLGDSWTQFGGQWLGSELARLLPAQVATFGKGGTTTDWGIAWLDEALRQNPDVDTVIVHFYTNDLNNNQGSTMTLPDGSVVPMWPDGLTQEQAEARWIDQINLLITLIQQRGLRPVIVGPGTVNVFGQLPAAIHLERPPLVAWQAGTTELADESAYINRVGKRTGATVTVGTSTRTATGPAPGDPWTNDVESALLGIQRSTLARSTYETSAVDLTVDTDGDGFADGLTEQRASGVRPAGDVYTFTVSGGRQHVTATWDATSSNAVTRLRMDADVTAGREYLAIIDVVDATPDLALSNSVSLISGSVVTVGTTINAQGAVLVTHRATATTTGTQYIAISPSRTAGSGYTMQVQGALVADLTALFADAPNLKGLSDSDLAEFVLSLQ